MDLMLKQALLCPYARYFTLFWLSLGEGPCSVLCSLKEGKAESRSTLKYHKARYPDPWCDRRSGFERRRFKNPILQVEQRSGKDRRCFELPEIIKYRKARTQLRRQLKDYHASRPLERCLVGTIILAVIMALLSIMVLLGPL